MKTRFYKNASIFMVMALIITTLFVFWANTEHAYAKANIPQPGVSVTYKKTGSYNNGKYLSGKIIVTAKNNGSIARYMHVDAKNYNNSWTSGEYRSFYNQSVKAKKSASTTISVIKVPKGQTIWIRVRATDKKGKETSAWIYKKVVIR